MPFTVAKDPSIDEGSESSATEPDVSTEPGESETESDSSWIEVDSDSDNEEADDVKKTVAKNRYANEACNISLPALAMTFIPPIPRNLRLFYLTMDSISPARALVKTSFAER